jgi:hypothetical protein
MEVFDERKMASNSSKIREKNRNLSPAPRAGALARSSGTGVRRRSATRHGARRLLAIARNRLVELLALCRLGRGAVPVVGHLGGEDSVEHEASDEAIQDKRVVDFLQRGEDARERAKEVVDDLCRRVSLESIVDAPPP